MLSLRTLGGIRLSNASGEPLAGRRKDLVVLAYLAMRSPRPVRRDELVGLFWDERDQRHALQSLRQVLVRLRRTVGEGLTVDRELVRLGEGAVRVDARAFAADVAAGLAAAAVERWRGDFLPGADDVGGEAYRAWLDAERESLRQGLESAFQQLVATARAAGDWSQTAELAGRWVEWFPLGDLAQRQLVEALYRSGRITEAGTRHAAFAVRVRRELGDEPSPEFRTLLRRLEAEASHASPTPAASPGSAALFTPDLVGRDAAWRELDHAWQLVRGGSGVTLVVEAGEGLGKTFLCERFLQYIADAREPSLVLRAHGRPEHQDRGWHSARELLAPLSGAPGLGGAANDALSAVSRLVPAIRTRYPNLPAPPEDERGLPGAVAEVLMAVAQEVPVVLFLDELPMTDRPTADLTLSLARHQPPGTLLLITARPDWLGPPGALPELYQIPGVRRLKLPPLSVAEIQTLLESVIALPPEESRALAPRLHQETGGNPFFATEIVSAMVDEGRLAPDARGIWRTAATPGGATLPLPSSVVDAVARRLARLSGAAQRLAAAAATLEEPFRRNSLPRATGLTAAQLEAGLDELVARRLLRPVAGAGADALEFTQPLIRRVAQERLGGVCGAEPRPRRLTRYGARFAAGVAIAITLLAAAAAAVAFRAGAARGTPVLAIGQIGRAGLSDTVAAAHALGDMLATNLARVPGLRVISNARMYQNVAVLGNGREAAAVWSEAAVRAGAEELLEGNLLRTGSGLRLDMRRIDLRTGQVRGGYTVAGANAFELADRATAEIAADLGLSGSSLRLADVTTSSLVAYRFYEEGLRSYARADYRGAIRLFDAAFAEDSSFAMAAHYALRARQAVNVPVPSAARDAVLRLADRTSDRERLLIRGTWAPVMAAPAVPAIAETLAIRYPTEPDGHLLLGTARSWSGDFLGAIPHLRRVVTMDSLALLGTHANCRACEAFYAMVNAYIMADSLPAAERVARQWVRLQPGSGRAWHQLATALEYQGREQAPDARRQAMTLSPGHPYDAVNAAIFHIRTGGFASADRLLTELARDAQPDIQREALWFLTISLRNQGRLREALATATRLEDATRRQAAGEAITSGGHRAQVLLELGRAREAEAMFRTLGSVSANTDYIPWTEARFRCWYLTHRAGALAALGDTATLALLADSIEWWGGQSTYGRDQRLHQHARGLLLVARGQPTLAVRAFERAIYSRTVGYTRTNLELAKVLITLRRPAEAVSLLQSALRGGIEANNLYVTRTELQYVLGRAWDAAGSADSAAAQYRRVLAAWHAADPQFQARRDSIRNRLVALGKSASN